MRKLILICCLCLAALHQDCGSTGEISLAQRVRRFTLPNGMRFLLVRRGTAPVFSAHLKVVVGNIEEEAGATGLAHFFEHMAFKGTDKVGTRDWEKESPLLEEVLRLGTSLAEARKSGAAPETVAELEKRLKAASSEEDRYITKNDYITLFQRNGGRDLNATTSNDFTSYYVSLPSDKIELWAYLESERLKNRVFRDFFTEVQVVAEERRLRIDNSPDGRLYEAFTAIAFDKSPYRYHPIGSAEDILDYTPAEARSFYERYYIPSRMVAVLVGDFDPDAAEAVVRKYFEPLPARPDSPRELEPEPAGAEFPRSTVIRDRSRPRFYLGYRRPAHPHSDDIVLDVVRDILCEGRASRLYRRLVIEEKLAAWLGCNASIPGARLDGLFTFSASPLGEHANAQIVAVIKKEVALLASEGPSENELRAVKNRLDAELVYALESNKGLASTLAFYEALTGDWRYMEEKRARVRAMTAQDIKRVAAAYFVPEREAAAYLETEE